MLTENKKINPSHVTFQNTLKEHLVGHWKMDSNVGSDIVDDSGNELHGKTKLTTLEPGKFSRSLYFDGKEKGIVTIPNNPAMNFGSNSFSLTSWVKNVGLAYPKTTLPVRQGLGCAYLPTQSGSTPGWQIGEGHQSNKMEICIRDDEDNKSESYINFNADFTHSQLLGKWTHYAVVFDREAGKVFLYINGKKQADFVDISSVTGSVGNDKPLTFGYMSGWKMHGNIDEYRLYNIALNNEQTELIFNDHRI